MNTESKQSDEQEPMKITLGGEGQTFSLVDTTRQPHSTPCPDCSRTYLNGENVTMTVPSSEGGYRVVWSGCCDCWIGRTSPGKD